MPIEITEVFYPKTRAMWRKWLEKNYQKKTEVWVRLFKKASANFLSPTTIWWKSAFALVG